MAFCQQCGTQNPDGSRFCTGCGADLTAQAAPQQAAPVNPNPAPYQQFGQTPQAFAQSGIGNYGTPAGLSKKEFLNQPENAKLKNNLKSTTLVAVIMGIATLIINILTIEAEKARIEADPRLVIDESVLKANYTWLALLTVSVIITVAAYFTLNMFVGIAAAVVYIISMIVILSNGGTVSILGFAMVVFLVFMPYNLFTLGKQYDEYKGRSGMNL